MVIASVVLNDHQDEYSLSPQAFDAFTLRNNLYSFGALFQVDIHFLEY